MQKELVRNPTNETFIFKIKAGYGNERCKFGR